MRTYKTEGIILKRSNYGEADRILTVFTKHYGKIKVLAKGVRRIKSRRGPNVELFNWVTLFLHKGKNFDLLSEAEVKNSFPCLKRDLCKVAVAYQFCEMVDGLCPEKQEHGMVFDYLIEALSGVSSGPSVQSNLIADFELNLLQELGYWPRHKLPPLDLENFIEQILERKLKTPKFLTQVQIQIQV